MSDAVTVALIVGVPAFISPLALQYFTSKQRSREKKEDWARQDEVAKQLLDAQKATTKATENVAIKAKETADATATSLRQIHTLVNSDMTAARAGELRVTRLSLANLKRLIAKDKEAGMLPSDDDLLAVKEAEESITNLEAILADRATQQKIVEAEQEAASRESAKP